VLDKLSEGCHPIADIQFAAVVTLGRHFLNQGTNGFLCDSGLMFTGDMPVNRGGFHATLLLGKSTSS